MTYTRRSVVSATGILATSGLAGCIGNPPGFGDDTDLSGMAAFFGLYDWATQVGGDRIAFEMPVEAGEMGHGWDPDADLVPEVAGRDVFVYLGTPEFQWAIDVSEALASDHEDVVRLDGMEAISQQDLLSFQDDAAVTPGGEPDQDETFDPDSFTVGEFELIVGNDVMGWWHDNHWHGGIPDVPLDADVTISLHVEDERGRIPPLGEDEPFQFDARLADGAPDNVLDIESDGSTVTLSGLEDGQTLIVFELRADNEVIFDTASDPGMVRVTHPDEIEIDAFHDPHVWVDPVLAQDIVDQIATTFAQIDPDHASEYEDNADTLNERLSAVDQQFQDLVAEAELDVAVFAGHDSFQYVENRYGFTLKTPVGVTPDAAESIDDVVGLVDIIEEHGIDTILYDPFEAPNPDEDVPQAVEVLQENTDAADAAPLTPVEGTTSTWREEGYGWIEQMEEINLPSLRQALRAET